jgi:ribonuclease BN (tRNA processing enzyme)
MKVIPFGTNGFFSSFGRQTACYAVPIDQSLIILDAGTGLFRFAEKMGLNLLKHTREIHLFLSHYHLDHTMGFYAAFQLFKGIKVNVYSLTDREVFSELVKINYFPVDFKKVHRDFKWYKLDDGERKIGKFIVKSRVQNHRNEKSLAFRFHISDRVLSYITDGEISEENNKFIQNSDLLMHEGTFSGEKLKNESLDKQIIDGHVTVLGAALIAKKAKVKKLVLIHHEPTFDNNKMEKQLMWAKKIFLNTSNALDLKEISF